MSIDLDEIREVDRLCKQRTERDNAIDLVRARKALAKAQLRLLVVAAISLGVGLILGALI